MKKELSDIKHARSAKEYPEIDLVDGEYVVLKMERSKLGVGLIWFITILVLIVFTACMIFLMHDLNNGTSFLSLNASSKGYLWLAIICIYAMMIVGGIVGQSIYCSNKMYITNIRAIQKIRTSIFANSTNIIELKRIEDISYRQNSIWDHIFQVGTIRMSTVGDETTYTFNFIDTPHDEVDIISRLIQQQRAIKHKSQDEDDR